MASAGISIGSSLLKLGMGLLAAHDQRYKDATNENLAVAQAVQVFDNDLAAIFSGLNAGTVSEASAIQYLQQTEAAYFKYVGQYQGKPGVASHPCSPATGGPTGHGACQSGTPCDKTCTAGCCVGCNVIVASTLNAIAIIQAGGGSFTVCKEFPDTKYKNPGRESYVVTYVRPNLSAGTVGAAEGFLNQIGGLVGLPSGQVNNPSSIPAATVLGTGSTSKLLTYFALGLVGLFLVKEITK